MWTRADVAADIDQGTRALQGREFAAADATFRKAFEAADATVEQRASAFDGLLAAAVELSRAGDLAAYLQQRRAAAPKDQQPLFPGALARAGLARDGHLHGVLAAFERDAGDPAIGPYGRRVAREAQEAFAAMSKGVGRLAQECSLAGYDRLRQAGVVAQARRDRVARQASGGALLDVAIEFPRLAVKAGAPPPRVPAPEVPRARIEAPASVALPKADARPNSARLAAVFFNQVYQKATELAGQGMVESAKAEYATLMQLFPDTAQAQQAARYALNLFRRDRVAGAGEPLTAYLQWVRAVLGPKGSDEAEHLAFKVLADDADPNILAREAEAFLARHPASKHAPGVRLQLAVALDRTGATPRAIEVLAPLAAKLDDPLAIKAAQILAWLRIFQGEPDPARTTLQALAAQTVAADAAADARSLLAAMAAHPLPKLTVAEVVGGDNPGEALASRILEAADQQLQRGDGERAMDLYELFLRVGKETDNYKVARERIERIKRTGRAEEE